MQDAMVQVQNDYDLVVIGAGWYGLIAAYTYLQLAPTTRLLIVDDGDSVGGVWSSERIYPHLFAQVGHGLFEYSFYPMKKEGFSKDRYIKGTAVNEYLQSFTRDFGLQRLVLSQTTVTRIRKDGETWALNLKRSEVSSDISSTKVIVASGVTSKPFVPQFPTAGFKKPIIHSSELGSQMTYMTGPMVSRATVIGASKSAYDTVYLLLKAGKEVDWVIRENGSGPMAIASPKIAGCFNTVDAMATRAFSSFSPAILHTSGLWYRFLQRSWIGNLIVRLHWRITTLLFEMEAGFRKSPNLKSLQSVPHGYGLFWANAGIGVASAPDFWETFQAGGVNVHRGEVSRFGNAGCVSLNNGTVLDTDHVTLCTGWTDNLDIFDEATRIQWNLPSLADLDEKWGQLDATADKIVLEKLPYLRRYAPIMDESLSTKRPWRLYRRLISPSMAAAGDRSIFFAGQVHTAFTPLVAEVQALWGCAFLLNKLKLPEKDAMEEEISLWYSWTCRRYLNAGAKHAYSIFDFLAYIDTLAQDLGLNTQRKSNSFSEMFAPYRPRDWKGMISEYMNQGAQHGKAYQENKRFALGLKEASGWLTLILLMCTIATMFHVSR